MLKKYVKRVSDLFIKYPLIVAFVYSFLMFMLVCIFAYPCCETSDDFLISGILSGVAGESSPYVLVISYPLSYILYFLELWVPQLNWLTILELFSVWSSFSVFIWVFLRKRTVVGNIVAIVMPLIFETAFYMSLQYTRSAIILSFAGLFLIFYCWFKMRNKLGCIAGGILFVIGSLFRFASVFLVIPYVALWIIILVGKKAIEKKIQFRNCVYFLLFNIGVLGIVLGLNQYHKSIYRNSEIISQYVNFNNARAKAYDYLPKEYKDFESEFKAIGISNNDYEMLRGNMIYDDFFDKEKYQDINEINTGENNSISEKWRAVKKRLLTSSTRYGNGRIFGYPNTFILFLSIVFISLILISKQSVISFLGTFGGTVIIVLYFVWTVRFPPWVQDSLYFVASFNLLYGIKLESSWLLSVGRSRVVKKLKNIITYMICISLIIFCFYFSGSIFKLKANTIKPDEQLCLALNSMERDKDNIYLIDNFAFSPYPIMDAYGNIRGMEKGSWSNIIRVGSWYLEHPVLNSQLEALGLTSPIREIVREDIYLFTDLDSGNLKRYQIFLEEHYDMRIKTELISQWGKYAIYSFRPANE